MDGQRADADCDDRKPALGFLTVVEHPQHGLFGGYLVLNAAGRPLEFHCTAPIKANRAQEILYGPTLADFLYGEQIGGTLLASARIATRAVFTDCRPALAVRYEVSVPTALVLPPEDAAPGDLEGAEAGACHPGTSLFEFRLGRNRLAVAAAAAGDRRLIEERLAELAGSLDLLEPFGRIREAIEEAQKAVRAAA
jgi:hypothetical protein